MIGGAIIVFIWWAIGFVSFAFWWTKDFDLDPTGVILGVIVALAFGPFAFLVRYLHHGKENKKVVLQEKGND